MSSLESVVPTRTGVMACHSGTQCSAVNREVCVAYPKNSSTICEPISTAFSLIAGSECSCDRMQCDGTPFCELEEVKDALQEEKEDEFESLIEMRQQVSVDPEFSKERMERVSLLHKTTRKHEILKDGREFMHIGRQRKAALYRNGAFENTLNLLSQASESSKLMGCLPLHAKQLEKPTSYMAEDCIKSTDPNCLSGLPFFRMMGMKNAEHCLQFCVSKGLDVAGFSKQGKECRCGVSQSEVGLLSQEHANKARMAPLSAAKTRLQTHLKGGKAGSECGGTDDFVVLKYNGEYTPAGSIPPSHYDHNIDEILYIDAMLTGHWHHEDRPEEEEKEKNFLGSALTSKSKPWKRRCYPKTCGAGDPWPKVSTQGPYYDRAEVTYCYKSGTTAARKEVFAAATANWYANSCIKFKEVSCTNAPSYTVHVGSYDTSSCYSYLGYKKNSAGRINLGWCNSMSNLGNVIHEIGHTLGMNHVQKRKDAASKVDGLGPYLTVHWDRIPNDWKSQYQASDKTYMGGKTSGRAAYNYGSIMHYGRTLSGVTVIEPTSPATAVIGQRNGLNAGDLAQIADMYQCQPRTVYTNYPTPFDAKAVKFAPTVVAASRSDTTEEKESEPAVLSEDVAQCFATCCKKQIDSCRN